MASRSLKTLAATLSLAGGALAQSTNETVWSSFAYILYGERTPLRGQLEPSLTPLGAQQLYSQGSLFRSRYLSNSSLSDEDNAITTNSPIAGIERLSLDNSQLSLYSTADDYVVGGALAFMQGLYPPVTGTFAYDNGGVNASRLANGTMIDYPLNGYQYPTISTVTLTDVNAVWLEGQESCPEHDTSMYRFMRSDINQEMYNSTLEFYENLWPEVFPNTLANAMINFNYAYDLYDYAQYAYDHDSSIRDALGSDNLRFLRQLANIQQFNLNGDLTASGAQEGDMIRAIAGRTLAGKIVAQLSQHISSGSTQNKLSLVFGSFEPFLAFFALSDLAYSSSSSTGFTQIPDPGSAMVFELFSTEGNLSYPDRDDLWVRFVFRNGTDAAAPFTEYPLFGRGNSESRMRWADFQQAMGNFSIRDFATWCDTCSSLSPFCHAYGRGSYSSGSGGSGGGSGAGNAALSPAVAGVIGAVITVAVLGLAGVTAFVFGGIRVRRKNALDAKRRSSSLGGFKGAEKMASDHDVSVAKSGAKHERVGSWELGSGGVRGSDVKFPPPAAVNEHGTGFGLSGKSRPRDDADADSITGLRPVEPVERV